MAVSFVRAVVCSGTTVGVESSVGLGGGAGLALSVL